VTALEAQALAARKVRSFRLHLGLATSHLGRCDLLEAEISALLRHCSPEAAKALREALNGLPATLAQEGEAAP
jgi:hypothetical protein